MHKKAFVLLAGAVAGLLLAACATPTPEVKEVRVEVTREVTVTQVVEVTAAPVVPVIPNEEAWAGSPHADKTALAFNDWNEANPPEVPPDCARCHSTPGFQDFIGSDGSEAGKVDQPAPVGTVIQCDACHNPVASTLSSVTFPSGAEITGLGPEARCLQCHQGRASKTSVDESITKANLTDDDTIGRDLGFTNIHYLAAGATMYGTQAKGGYEYEGKTYDAKFQHVEGLNTCVGCHNPHTLELRLEKCQVCHTGVQTEDDLKNIRMFGSAEDYNGNGDTQEGIYYELDGLRTMLYQAIQAYANEVSKTPIVYDAATYPYFFKDTNGDGAAEADEVKFENKYDAWTGRLAKAAYNYQTSIKDPGAFAHGGKYIIELMYDSIENLNEKLSAQVDLSKARRIDAGHFASSTEPFRHWDAEGEVPNTCARCHSAMGLATFIKDGVNISVPPATSGFLCANCHDDLATFTRRALDAAKFPSGATLTFGEGEDANLCIACHQGRESTVSVNNAVKGIGDDELRLREDGQTSVLGFRNIHYFAAGATLFGDAAKGAYEYDRQTYLGQFQHQDPAGGLQGPTQCVECHNVHTLEVKVDLCLNCHKTVKTVEDLKAVRGPSSDEDYDGDGNVEEGLYGELDTFREKLYAAIQAHARGQVEFGIVYNPAAYPYFFLDADDDGQPDKNDQGASIGYNKWTPRLLKAAYNYQYSQKDPGAFAHNGKYVIQFLYDSLKDVGGDVKGMTRP